MRHPFVLLLLLGGVACSPTFDLPAGAQINCTVDQDCPSNSQCGGAGRCVLRGDDVSAPTVNAAASTERHRVVVTFSEAVDPASGADPGNYRLSGEGPSGPLKINGVSLDAEGRVATVLTDEQWPAERYSVTVSNVSDLHGNRRADNGRADFVGYGAVDAAPPLQISPQPGAVVDQAGVTLIWSARAGARSWVVELATTPDFSAFAGSPPLSVQVEPGSHSLRFPDAARGLAALEPLTYWWRVRAEGASPAFDANYPSGSFDVLGSTIYVSCPAPGPCSDLARVGNKSKPLQTIMGGIAVAHAGARLRVHVAGRGAGAAYAEAVSLTANVSLFGGFAPNLEDRDLSRYETIIHSESMIQLTATNITSGTTEVDGFTIDADVPGRSWAVMISGSGGGLVISHCKLLAGSADRAAPNCSTTVALEVRDAPASLPPSASPLISDNVIDNRFCAGGISPSVFITGANPRLLHNVVTAGDTSSPGAWVWVVALEHSRAFLDGNTIHADTPSAPPTEIRAISGEVDVRPTLVNNVIWVGAAPSYGIKGRCPGCRWFIANNTIVIESDSVFPRFGIRVATSSEGVRSKDDNVIVNNLVVLERSETSATVGIGTSNWGDLSIDQLTLENNASAGFSQLYSYESGDMGPWVGTIDPLWNNLDDPRVATFVACPSGSSNHCLAPGNPAVGAGRTVSGLPCPTALGECDFSTDRDGAPRTLPWSIGAYR